MPKPRYQPPDRLVGATDFSEHPELCGSLNVVRLLEEHPEVWDELRDACELEVNYARKREAGNWELAAVAFVVSGHVDIKPWWANTTDELWRECGFKKGKPPYKRTWERLRELEQAHGEFLKAAGKIIKRAREHDERVMAHAHIDYTEDETHAALVHDCQPDEPCKRRTETASGQPRRATDHPLRLPRAATAEARRHREEQNEEDLADSEKHEARDTPKNETVERDGRDVKRVKVGGCWYVTRDVEAGVRAYGRRGKTTRFWNGYYSGKLVDHYTSGVIPSVDPANKQECHLFKELFDCAKDLIGEAPQTVIGDRGSPWSRATSTPRRTTARPCSRGATSRTNAKTSRRTTATA